MFLRPKYHLPNPKIGEISRRNFRVSAATWKGQNFYQTLGVSKDADIGEIKTAYRRGVRTCHPDVDNSKSATKRFEELSKAYKVLSDPRLRLVYDNHGPEALNFSSEGASVRANKQTENSRFWAGKSENGEDIRQIVELRLEESVLGVSKIVNFTAKSYCKSCQGSGFHPTAPAEPCELCRGSGFVKRRRTLADGLSLFLNKYVIRGI